MKSLKNTTVFTLSSILLISGCASVHNGNYAKVEGVAAESQKKEDSRRTASGLVVSGQEIRDFSSKFITQIDLTFENKSAKWIHIKSVKLDFGSNEANEAISIPVGADLEAWVSAAKQNQAIKDYNFNLAMASVGVAGAGLAAGSSNSTQRNAGAFALAGASTALTINTVRSSLNSIELAKLVPDSHILSSNFVVPPGMHTKKWLAVYAEKPYNMPYIDSVTLEITTSDDKVEKLKLPFRTGSLSKSTWQKDHPDSKSSRWEAYLEKKKETYRRNNQTPDVALIRSEYVQDLTQAE